MQIVTLHPHHVESVYALYQRAAQSVPHSPVRAQSGVYRGGAPAPTAGAHADPGRR